MNDAIIDYIFMSRYEFDRVLDQNDMTQTSYKLKMLNQTAVAASFVLFWTLFSTFLLDREYQNDLYCPGTTNLSRLNSIYGISIIGVWQFVLIVYLALVKGKMINIDKTMKFIDSVNVMIIFLMQPAWFYYSLSIWTDIHQWNSSCYQAYEILDVANILIFYALSFKVAVISLLCILCCPCLLVLYFRSGTIQNRQA